MKEVKIISYGKETTAVVSRNMEIVEGLKNKYNEYRFRVKHRFNLSTFHIKPNRYWDKWICAGRFFCNLPSEKITYFTTSDYDPVFISVFAPLVELLSDEDILIVSVEQGRLLWRYKITVANLRKVMGKGIDNYGRVYVNKQAFDVLQPKPLKRGRYAKK